MKLLALIALLVLAAAVLSSCGKRIETCNDGGPHEWGKWADEWAAPDPGHMKQSRHCQKCGVIQVGYHK
jgi:hypothetical protein